jgi:AcrR family transcriptional regulator
MDRRQQKTRSAIFDAFSRLLDNSKYNKITIKDIINEANISRSTFYDHFESKDDLLKEMYQELFQHIFSNDLQAEESHDFSGRHDSISSFFTHTLYHIKDNTSNLNGILSCESSELFWNYMKEQFSLFVKQYILSSGRSNYIGIPDHVLINHLSCSLIELIKLWIKGKRKESPETIAMYFEKLVNPLLINH